MLIKKFYFILLPLLLVILRSNSTKAEIHIITNHFEVYDPDSLTIMLGDTVLFQLDSFHNALEVNYSTWDSAFAISNGGFYVPFGGGIWIPDTAGTYYYVCELHAHDGMVGLVKVLDPLNVPAAASLDIPVTFFPNPAADKIFLEINNGSGENDNWDFTLYSLHGNLVLNKTFRGNKEIINLKDGKLTNGIYLAEISNRGARYFEKLVLDLH